MSQELVKRDTLPLASINPEALIAHAIENKTDVSVMKELLAMRAALRAENAKSEYDRAMAAFQAECPIIQKTKAGANNYYKFAPLDHIILQVRELIRKHGFSFSITSEITEGWVKAICTIKHEGGHSEESVFQCPIDANPKNAMSAPQRYGASMTFSKRYSFCNGFGIMTADEDVDAGKRGKPAGPSTLAADVEVKDLAKQVWNKLAKVRGTEKNWQTANNWLWREELLDAAADERCPNLSVARFKTLLKALEGRDDL